jgi:hydroxymethylpyrimidine pyrophosphatase-like HAD family hydrolase
MRYHALACDYDGALAQDDKVGAKSLALLEKLLGTGRKLILVTGREVPDLLENFQDVKLFHWVVAENGALLYDPATRQEELLVAPIPPAFAETLRQRGVPNISIGRSIVFTWRPHEGAVLAAIHDSGTDVSPQESRQRICELIERYYAPSSPPLPIPGTDAASSRSS